MVWRRIRQPVRASLAGALALVFLLGVAGVLWQWQRANWHVAEESIQRQRAEALSIELAQLAAPFHWRKLRE